MIPELGHRLPSRQIGPWPFVRNLALPVDDEEEEINVRCIGAPILNSHEQAIAAISITGTVADIDADSRDRLIASVKAAAAAIAAQFVQREHGLSN